jgi:hypothetical protein
MSLLHWPKTIELFFAALLPVPKTILFSPSAIKL